MVELTANMNMPQSEMAPSILESYQITAVELQNVTSTRAFPRPRSTGLENWSFLGATTHNLRCFYVTSVLSISSHNINHPPLPKLFATPQSDNYSC